MIDISKYCVGERVHQPDKTGKQPAPFENLTLLHGMTLLRDPLLNKGTAFSASERDKFGLRGLLPPCVLTMQTQADRVLTNLRTLPTDLEKYVALNALHDRNEALFFRVVCDNIDEIQPIIYTPTVGLACQKYGLIFQRPRGMFISANERGKIAEVLKNWPYQAKLIVVTDGERILGGSWLRCPPAPAHPRWKLDGAVADARTSSVDIGPCVCSRQHVSGGSWRGSVLARATNVHVVVEPRTTSIPSPIAVETILESERSSARIGLPSSCQRFPECPSRTRAASRVWGRASNPKRWQMSSNMAWDPR